MTYGYRPENWSRFQSELQRHGLDMSEIEKVVFRPVGDAPAGTFDVSVTLRSGRVEVLRPRPEDKE